MKYCNNSLSHHMYWSTKEKAFCVEAYFANNSYKVVQASFQRKVQCHHVPSKSNIFDRIQKYKAWDCAKS